MPSPDDAQRNDGRREAAPRSVQKGRSVDVRSFTHLRLKTDPAPANPAIMAIVSYTAAGASGNDERSSQAAPPIRRYFRYCRYMCGIAGIISAKGLDPGLLERMTSAVAHRGPDDVGLWIDAEARVGLGHRRLAIVDLSPAGHQPMLSADGRFVLTFNGEIYNHADLRT